MQRPKPETVTLQDILITEELSQRNPRPANLVAENQALHALAQQLVNQPQTMLQNLVDMAIELCNAGTAGVSLLETTPTGEEVFRWNVLAGTLAQHVGGTTPRNFSPCGVCLERGKPVLFSHPDRYFTYFQAANTPIVEGLVLPLIADNHALGTIWIMSHDEQRHFDGEDVRVMTSLADFTAAALLLNQRQTQELRESEVRLQAMIENLPGGAAFVVDRNLRYLLAEGEALHTAGFKREDLVGKTIFDVLTPELAAEHEERYRKALAGESFEYEHNAHDRWYISRATPLRSPNGEVYAVLAVSYDISDRKRAEVAAAADLEDTQRLRELSARLVTEGDIQTLYQEIISTAIALTRADAGTVQILDEATQDLLLLATQGFERNMTDHFYRVSASSNTSCGIALNSGDRAFIDFDVPESEDPDGSMRIHIEEGFLSAQSTPLITRSGKPIGMVSTHWRKHHRPSDRELRFLDLLARQAADLIEQRQSQAALRESEAWLASQKSAFQAALKGAPLEASLGVLVRTVVEQANTDIRCAFYIGDETGSELYHVVGMPENYVECVDGFKISADSLACGLAFYTGQPIITPDVTEDPRWQDWLWLSQQHDYRGVWSFPIETTQEKVIGTFAMYFRHPRQATPRDYEFAAVLTRAAAIIISQNQEMEERARAEEKLRRAAEMDAFRVKLSDALRSLADAREIKNTACELLGRHLRTNRVNYFDVKGDRFVADTGYANGVAPLTGGTVVDFGEVFLREFRDNEMMVSNDVQNDLRFSKAEREYVVAAGIAAFIVVLLVKNGQWVAAFAAHNKQARQWMQTEVDLIREVAERIRSTAERALAEAELRESELQRLQEQSTLEQERQRAEALAELDRAKTLFFSNISHEFRTPLTLLLAPLQDALSDRTYPLAPPQRDRLEIAHRNSLRLLKLVNNLLDFSRIEAGRMEAVYEPTDLAMFTTELASVFRSAIERAGLRLVVDCPPISEPVYVDRQMWEKIVLNLLSNAFKFTLEGEIAVRLYLADGDRVTLQVQDTGIGIASEELPHLFKRFYSVRGAKGRTHEGSGIGLALVHELIKLHGGTIDVSSTVGVGSCFTVTIPLGTAHLQSDRLQLDVGDRTTATRTLTSTTLGAAPYVQEEENRGAEENVKVYSSPSSHILLVDDNADMRDYLTRILSEHDIEVEAIADGEAALAAVTGRLPDLVLTDVMMPNLDGFELLKALRADARTKEVPIILLSARAGEESVIEGLQAGADDYLIKPFSAQELVARVLAHLQMAQLRNQALHQEKIINRKKDEFLATVSHELNTPLVAILGWTRLLRSSQPSQAMLMKSLETIERNATLQAKLVEDLLDISRITAGKIHLHLQPVELQEIIETAIASLRQSLETKAIQLECTLAPSPKIVQGDPDRLQQIILNILSNAIKFTPNGGRIKVELETQETQAHIVITDNGCGIDAELLPYIFDTFRQVSTAKKGLGLGLAIARNLVELHGGTIQAQSPGVGQGASFIVKLPLRNQ